MPHRPVLILVILLVTTTMMAVADAPPNMVVGSLSFMTHPFGAVDPYSWAFGGGVAYERRLDPVRIPLLLGGRAIYHDSRATEEMFGNSGMFILGVYAGVPFEWELDADALFVVTPVLGLSQYWRRFEHSGGDYTASRPIVFGGAMVDMHVGPRTSFGLCVELGLILDQDPVIAVNQALRLGYRF